jgi:SNF family Na+-dependent transporter
VIRHIFSQVDNSLTNLPEIAANQGQLSKAFSIIFGVAAALAAVTIALAAFNYATAATDTDKIMRSRKAILLAVVGLAISLLGEAIVLTVANKL